MQQELTPATGFPSLLRKLFKSYLRHMAFLFLSLPQVANVHPQQNSLMLERLFSVFVSKQHLSIEFDDQETKLLIKLNSFVTGL